MIFMTDQMSSANIEPETGKVYFESHNMTTTVKENFFSCSLVTSSRKSGKPVIRFSKQRKKIFGKKEPWYKSISRGRRLNEYSYNIVRSINSPPVRNLAFLSTSLFLLRFTLRGL